MGLRERKKERTRADLQRHALRLFRERGWAATTVDDIAEAAEVSRSTFFRYFPSKVDVVLFDDVDPLMEAAFAAQPPGTALLTAIRTAIADAHAGLDEEKRALEDVRMDLARTEPEVAAALRDGQGPGTELMMRTVAGAVGRDATEVEVAVFVGVLNGARQAATALVAREPGRTYVDTLVEVLTHLEGEIPLARAPIRGGPIGVWPWGRPAREIDRALAGSTASTEE